MTQMPSKEENPPIESKDSKPKPESTEKVEKTDTTTTTTTTTTAPTKRTSLTEKFKVGWGKVKEEANTLTEKAKDRLKMEGLLAQARESLQKFLDPELQVEKQIPKKLLEKAQGIVFLSVLKAGFGFGGEAGSGCIIIRDGNGKDWSPPIAIGAAGIKWGLQIGASKVDYIMVLTNKEAVKTFTGDGQLKLGGDMNVSVGPKGRDADLGVIASDKSAAAIYSYAMAKGAYIGITLKGEVIAVRQDCNEDFYKKKAKPQEIIDNKVTMPSNSDYNAICAIMDAYVETKGESDNVEEEEQKEDGNNEEDPLDKGEVAM